MFCFLGMVADELMYIKGLLDKECFQSNLGILEKLRYAHNIMLNIDMPMLSDVVRLSCLTCHWILFCQSYGGPLLLLHNKLIKRRMNTLWIPERGAFFGERFCTLNLNPSFFFVSYTCRPRTEILLKKHQHGP